MHVCSPVLLCAPFHHILLPTDATLAEICADDIISTTDIMDIDQRCRILLREIDRAQRCKRKRMDSGVLHSAKQRFDTKVLQVELARDLDETLMEQIKEREGIYSKTVGKKKRKKLGEEDDAPPSPIKVRRGHRLMRIIFESFDFHSQAKGKHTCAFMFFMLRSIRM